MIFIDIYECNEGVTCAYNFRTAAFMWPASRRWENVLTSPPPPNKKYVSIVTDIDECSESGKYVSIVTDIDECSESVNTFLLSQT